MNLDNDTDLQAGFTTALERDGRECLVVVVKGTYTIPADPRDEPKLAKEQVPPVMTDVFQGEPGFSAPLYEIDFAPRKPRCDVLLNGSAYAPEGKPATRVTVSVRVGSVAKSFDVVGNRVWNAALLGYKASRPEAFATMPFSYGNAFGGIDKTEEDAARHHWYPSNHAGVGYSEHTTAAALDGKPMPNTEESDAPIVKANGKYAPMALGPIGRSWQPRVKFAGTYDQKWIDEVMPFLPADFDDRYFQAAPPDQQTEHLQGGEEVELKNLTPTGQTRFRVPKFYACVRFITKDGTRKNTTPVMDTLIIEPDQRRFMVVGRSRMLLPKNAFDVRRIEVLPESW